MLKSPEYSNCRELLSQESPNNRLHKTKHTSSSILSYRIGLDPIVTSYLVGWIE